MRNEQGTRTRTTYENERVVAFEAGSGSVIEAIVTTVAEIRGVEPNQLPPLGRAFDAELLERLTRPPASERVEGGHVTFTYADVTVTVDLEGGLQFEFE